MVDEPSSLTGARGPDWFSAAQRALGQLDDRARTIVVERVFRVGDPIPTLQEVGDRFNLSRERVRQIEAATVEKLMRTVKAVPELDAVTARIRSDLGLVFSRDELADAIHVELDAREVPYEVQLLLLMAGPYRIVGETMVATAFDAALDEALGDVVTGPVPLRDVRSAMGSLGIRSDQQLTALRGRSDIRILDGMIVAWSGTIGDKVAVVLAVQQRLMTADEIHEHIGEGSLTTLKNYLSGDARFQRRGPRRWGLSEWGGEQYKSIATEMADELSGLQDGIPIERLKRILDDKFGIVAASVEIMSVTHPVFVRDGVWVRLRHESEPYVPDTALEEARDCVVIGGAWAWRHLVTRDTLRGSGHIVPEAFAAMLRLFPRGRIDLASDFGDIPLYWPSQSPGIGSLRRIADSLRAAEDDYLFVIANGDRHLDFELIRRADLSSADAEEELLLRLGQADNDGPWLAHCATAIGLPPHARADEVEELLDARGDRELLRLFGATRRRVQGN